MTRCFVALGSNLGEPLTQLRQALTQLHNLPDTRVIGCSAVYQNPAIGPGEQPDYLNAVVALRTELPAVDLLHALQSIENQQGRQRGERWAARTLDLDILLYGDERFDTAELTVPHPRMLQRNFVLYPLHDVAPDLLLPDGSPLRRHLDSCPNDGLTTTTLTLQE